MVDTTLDIVRHDALQKRIKGGIAGSNRIAWSAKDIARIRDHIKSLPEKIVRATPTAVRKIEKGQV